MDIIRAKEILELLADGVNPVTGEILPQSDSCNQPDVVRALHAVLETIPAKRQRPKPANAGKPWSKEEEERLEIEFDSGKSVYAIAKEHGRSKSAIETRLAQLGKIEDTYYTKA